MSTSPLTVANWEASKATFGSSLIASRAAVESVIHSVPVGGQILRRHELVLAADPGRVLGQDVVLDRGPDLDLVGIRADPLVLEAGGDRVVVLLADRLGLRDEIGLAERRLVGRGRGIRLVVVATCREPADRERRRNRQQN